MTTHYLSIFNRDTKTLNFCTPQDPTTSLLKVEGPLSEVVTNAAKFIVTDGVLVKAAGRYPKCNLNEMLTQEQLDDIQSKYEKTTTKHLDTSEKIEAILV